MQTRLKFVLYIISILINILIIVVYIHDKQQNELVVHKQQVVTPERKKEQQANKIDTETDKGVDTQAAKPVSLGEFKLTGYCSCEICCGKWAYNRPDGVVYGAIGEELKEGYSIAVDPSVIAYGTEVIIDGKIYKAQDCGGAIKGNRIDVYFEDHQTALEHGVQHAEVFLKM